MLNPFDSLPKNWQSASFSASGSNGGSGAFATLQTPAAQTNAANQTNAGFQLPGAGGIKLPPWLSSNPDSNMGELLSSYAGVQNAFDPTGQVDARNNAIGYNTAAGTQAANNAASEYANRATQQGGSALGAGVVKAQSMMPVLQANASLKSEAADVAAKAHQDAASLASQIAGTIGSLRTSYLQTLTGFAQGQQGLALDTFKANQGVASDAANRQYQYAALQEQARQANLSASSSRNNSGLAAAQTLLGSKGPSGAWTTNNSGQLTSGQNSFNNFNQWTGARSNATNYLNGMLQ